MKNLLLLLVTTIAVCTSCSTNLEWGSDMYDAKLSYLRPSFTSIQNRFYNTQDSSVLYRGTKSEILAQLVEYVSICQGEHFELFYGSKLIRLEQRQLRNNYTLKLDLKNLSIDSMQYLSDHIDEIADHLNVTIDTTFEEYYLVVPTDSFGLDVKVSSRTESISQILFSIRDKGIPAMFDESINDRLEVPIDQDLLEADNVEEFKKILARYNLSMEKMCGKRMMVLTIK